MMDTQTVVRMLAHRNRVRLEGLTRRLAAYERRYPHRTEAADRARRARSLDLALEQLEQAERWRDWRRGVLDRFWFAPPRDFRARADRLQARYTARRAGRREWVALWLSGRAL
jgi:hypothetical protein